MTVLPWLAFPAAASDLCDALLASTVRTEAVATALASGDDPNETCHWTRQVPMIQTFGGVLFALLVPPIGIPLGIMETVPQRRKGSAFSLALGTGRRDILEPMLTAGAHPGDDAIQAVVDRDRLDLVELLLAHGATPNLDRLDAPLAGSTTRLARLVEWGVRVSSIDQIDTCGTTCTDVDVASAFLEAGLPAEVLLGAAADRGTVAVLQLALSQVDAEGVAACEALSGAVEAGRWTSVDALRAGGVPWQSSMCTPPLLAATERGSLVTVKRLLASGADPAAVDDDGETALMIAVEDARADLIAVLIQADSPLETASKGRTALGMASAQGRLSTVRTLLDAGADPTGGARSPLSLALGHGHLPIADVLIAAGAPVVVDDTLLEDLVDDGRLDVLQFLLSHGLAPDVRTAGGETLAVRAVRNRQEVLLPALHAAGVPLDGATLETSALWAAIDSCDATRVRAVWQAGADPDRLPRDGSVFQPCVSGDLERLLVEDFGLTPPVDRLAGAVSAGDGARVDWLLLHGADPNGLDDFGRTVVSRARDLDMIDRLVNGGARPDGPACWLAAREADPRRLERYLGLGCPTTGLVSRAVEHGDTAQLSLLLASGASPDGDGDLPPIHLAVQQGDNDALRMLLDAGADPLAADRWTRSTALGRALDDDNDVAIDLLIGAGHPVTQAVLSRDVARCRFERIPHRGSDVRRGDLRAIALDADCARAFRIAWRS